MCLHLVHIGPDRIKHCGNGCGGELRTIALRQHQLGAVKKETGRAALVDFDMRFLMAHHPAMRLHHGRQRQAIGRRAGGDPDRRTVTPKQIAEARIQFGAQAVAVIGIVGRIGGAHRLPQPGMNGGGIVGQERALHRHILSV